METLVVMVLRFLHLRVKRLQLLCLVLAPLLVKSLLRIKLGNISLIVVLTYIGYIFDYLHGLRFAA